MCKNREMLNKGWHKAEVYINYKARKLGKVVFKINPAYTSQDKSVQIAATLTLKIEKGLT